MLGNAINGTLRRGLQRIGGASIVPDRRAGFWYRDDFTNNLLGTTANNGTGSSSKIATSSVGHPGILRGGVTAAATPDRTSYDMNSGSSTFVNGGGVITVETELRIPTLSNGTDNIALRFGFAGAAQIASQVDFTTGVYFEQDYGNHGNSNNLFVCAANASVRTKTDSTQAPTANAWFRLKLAMAADGSSVTGYINDVAVAVVSTNLPNPNTLMAFGFHVVKTLGAGTLNVDFDFIEVMQTFSSQR